MNGVEALKRAQLDFLVQTSVTQWNYDEIPEIVEYAYQLGAKVLNLYFLVRTGRGKTVMDITRLHNMRRCLRRSSNYRQLMLGKCSSPRNARPITNASSMNSSPTLRSFRAIPSGTCPCGIYYCRITPEGELTPCPYLPVSVGKSQR